MKKLVELMARKDLAQLSIDASILIDVKMSNPNGDGDSGIPRQTSEDFGLISAVSMRRKIRNFPMDKSFLSEICKQTGISPSKGMEILESHDVKGFNSENLADLSKMSKDDFFNRFLDVRWFGTTLLDGSKGEKENAEEDGTTKKSKKSKTSGGSNHIARGPISIRHAYSIAPVNVVTQSQTRMTGTENGKSKGGAPDSLCVVEHGLYETVISYRPGEGEKVGTTNEDLLLFFALLPHMYDIPSAARPDVNVVRCIVGVHNNRITSFNRFNFSQGLLPVVKENPMIPTHSIADYILPDPDKVVDGMTGDFYSLV